MIFNPEFWERIHKALFFESVDLQDPYNYLKYSIMKIFCDCHCGGEYFYQLVFETIETENSNTAKLPSVSDSVFCIRHCITYPIDYFRDQCVELMRAMCVSSISCRPFSAKNVFCSCMRSDVFHPDFEIDIKLFNISSVKFLSRY